MMHLRILRTKFHLPWVTCWLVLRGSLDLYGEPLDGGHPARGVLVCLVSVKQDE